jgi:hypothetical protein
MQVNTLDYESVRGDAPSRPEAPDREPFAFHALCSLALSAPPVWLIVASFMAFADFTPPPPAMDYLLGATWLGFWASILTLVLSVVYWFYPEGHAGPLLLHVAAAFVVLIQLARMVS